MYVIDAQRVKNTTLFAFSPWHGFYSICTPKHHIAATCVSQIIPSFPARFITSWDHSPLSIPLFPTALEGSNNSKGHIMVSTFIWAPPWNSNWKQETLGKDHQACHWKWRTSARTLPPLWSIPPFRPSQYFRRRGEERSRNRSLSFPPSLSLSQPPSWQKRGMQERGEGGESARYKMKHGEATKRVSSRPLMCWETEERREEGRREREGWWGELWGAEELRWFHFLPVWGFSPSKLALAIESQWGEWEEHGSWGACKMGWEISQSSFLFTFFPPFLSFTLLSILSETILRVTS